MLNEAKKAYYDIISLMRANEHLIVFNINDLELKSRFHLFGLKLKEEYGFNIDPTSVQSNDWVKLGSNIIVAWYGPEYGRRIAYSDDKRQPKDELLLEVRFPSGAYVFGDHYPEKLYSAFFAELKRLGPKYTDTHNNVLYYSMENAGSVFNGFDDMVKTYREMDARNMRIKHLQDLREEIKRLEDLEKTEKSL